jgi:hypothetical protein
MSPAHRDARHPCAAVTARARIWVPGSDPFGLIRHPFLPLSVFDALGPPRDQVGSPFPEPGTNWDWSCARTRSL